MSEGRNISDFVLEKCRKILLKENKVSMDNIIEKENEDKFILDFIKTEKLNNFYAMLEDNKSKKIILRASIFRYMLVFNASIFKNYFGLSALAPSLFQILPNKEIFKNYMHKALFSFRYPVCNMPVWLFQRIVFELFFKRFYIAEMETYIKFCIFFRKQYYIKNIFDVRDDAVVFDIGAWKGDTAYFFSKRCNEKASIHCFEPDDDAFDILKKVCLKYKLYNTKQYNTLFSDKNEAVDFVGMQDGSITKKDAITVDEFVEKNNITRLDFIKMDVEGAELSILKGSVNTIKKLRPAIAVAIYHGGDIYFEDYATVPSFIKEITPNYKYYVRTFYAWGVETILYCVPEK